MRISASDIDFNIGYEEQRKYFREQVLIISQIAKKFKIVVTVEQHCGLLTSSAGQILDLMRDLNIENVGIVYDPGNTLIEGYERPDVQIEMLKNLIKNVHVKNGEIAQSLSHGEYFPIKWVKLDKGFLNWEKIIRKLKSIGYDGYLTLEDFSEFNSFEEKLIYDFNFLMNLIKRGD